jgi:hypothetical protein
MLVVEEGEDLAGGLQKQRQPSAEEKKKERSTIKDHSFCHICQLLRPGLGPG